MTQLLKVLAVSEVTPITKRDGTTAYRQSITLQEIGGKYANSYAATVFTPGGFMPTEGSIIAGSLRFEVRNYDGRDYQDVVLSDFVCVFNPQPRPAAYAHN